MFRKSLLSILAACACTAPSYAAPAQDLNRAVQTLTRSEIEAITRAITAPAVYIGRWAQAAVRAKAELSRQLRERSRKREQPDLALVRVCMKLTMRLNNRWLDGISGVRIYPGQEDFNRFAQAGLAALKAYSSRLDKEHVWGPVDDRAAQDILDRELRRGINRLPVYRGRGYPPEPQPTAEEQPYLSASRP